MAENITDINDWKRSRNIYTDAEDVLERKDYFLDETKISKEAASIWGALQDQKLIGVSVTEQELESALLKLNHLSAHDFLELVGSYEIRTISDLVEGDPAYCLAILIEFDRRLLEKSK